MRVGELADRSGISASTLRYYEKLGLLRPASRNASGYREYSKETLDQLSLIQRAKELGFSLREIRALLARPRGTSREVVLAAVASKLAELEREKNGTEHLLLAFAQHDREAIRKMLLSEGVDIAKVRKSFETFDFGATTDEAGIFITHRVERVFGIAEGLALREERRATAEDLLLAILEDGGGVAVHLIRACGGDPARIATTLREKLA